MVLDLIERKCLIIDVACPFDIRVKDNEKEKIENYQDLKREVKRIWKLRKVTVTNHNWFIRNCLERHRKVVGRDCLESLQRACLLGTARILRKVLDT